jgi:nitric oxide reductase large subunit
MKANSRLWRWLALIFVVSFGGLGYIGWQIYLSAPPIPRAVVSADGEVLFTAEQIQRGQQAWLSAGGQQLGSVWRIWSLEAPCRRMLGSTQQSLKQRAPRKTGPSGPWQRRVRRSAQK